MDNRDRYIIPFFHLQFLLNYGRWQSKLIILPYLINKCLPITDLIIKLLISFHFALCHLITTSILMFIIFLMSAVIYIILLTFFIQNYYFAITIILSYILCILIFFFYTYIKFVCNDIIIYLLT